MLEIFYGGYFLFFYYITDIFVSTLLLYKRPGTPLLYLSNQISLSFFHCVLEIKAKAITMAVKGLFGSVDEFLEICEKSGDSAYTALRSLLERLEDESTRTEARIFFSHLQKRFDSEQSLDHRLDTYHFRIDDIYLEQHEGIT